MILSDSVVLQAYLTIMQWAHGAEVPPAPDLAKGSCFVPKGTAVVPIWVPISAALVLATCEVAAATSPVHLVRQHPVTYAGLTPLCVLDCSLSLAPRDGFPTAKLFIAAGYQRMVR